MKKIILSLAVLLLVSGNAWATNKYLIANGGNWTDDTSWSTTALGAAANTNDTTKPTAFDDVFLIAASGQCTISAASVGKSLDASLYTNTLTHNAFTLTASGNITFGAGMTYTPTSVSSRITVNGAGTITSNGKALWSFNNSFTNYALGDDLNFVAQKTGILTIAVPLNLNGNDVLGNSATNRVFVTSSVLGTSASITGVTSASFANADFSDIAFTPSVANADIDLSAITGKSGNCGGNSIVGTGALTFTTAQNPTTLTGNTVSLSASAAQWSGGRVPLPQDTGVISLTAGQTLTADMPRLWKDISFGTATNFTLGNAVTSYGSLDLTGMGTFTTNNFSWTFESNTRNTNSFLTINSKLFVSVIFSTAGTASITLQDAFVAQNALCTATNSIFLGSNTLTLTRNASPAWTGAGTMNAGTSTIVISDTGSSAKTFGGGGLTYYNLTTPSGTGGVTITGSNSFNNITVAAGGKLTLTSTTTQTVNSFTTNGYTSNLVTLNASTPGSAATLTKTGGGVINQDFLSITDINVTPANTWYYGTNSTYVSGTGWNVGIGYIERSSMMKVKPSGIFRNALGAGVTR